MIPSRSIVPGHLDAHRASSNVIVSSSHARPTSSDALSWCVSGGATALATVLSPVVPCETSPGALEVNARSTPWRLHRG